MLYAFWTIGCQMNKADTEQVAGALEQAGWRPAASEDDADLIILNTCVVRGSAERRVLGKLATLKGLKRGRPETFVAVMGCFVPPERGELARRLPQVDLLFTVQEIPALLQALGARRSRDLMDASVWREPTAMYVGPREARPVPPSGSAAGAVARYVPIIYGCNNFCAYCIVPYRRGRERSRAPDEILSDVRGMISGGAREITLLGQNVDAYRFVDPASPGLPPVDLAELLRRVSDVPGLARIRFLTSHPRDMSSRLIDSVADLTKVCAAINLPVQAGDDDVLAAMGRGYTSAEYRLLVERIRGRIPGLALTTDLIVGFPGETVAQFENSLRLLSDLRFDAVHVAAFSPREGTRAAVLPDDVSPEEKSRRLHAVESLQTGIAAQINRALLGTVVEILVEGMHRGKWMGRTRTDKIVFFEDPVARQGQLVNIRITRAGPWSLQGELVSVSA